MIAYSLFLITTTITLILLLAIQQWKKNSSSQHKLPPGPTKLPIIGNLHQVIDADGLFHRSFARLSTHGPIVYLLLGRVPVVVVSSQALARELFTAAGIDINVSNRPKTVALHTLTYGSSDIAAAPYGELWRRLKKVGVVGFLSNRKVEGFRRAREEQVAKMMNSLHGQNLGVGISDFATCGSEGGVVVDVGKLLKYLTGSIMLRLVLGRTYRSDDEKKDGVGGGSQQDLFTRSLHFLDQVQTILGTFFFEDYFPAWGLGQWVDAALGSRRRLGLLFHELDAIYEEILQRHEKRVVGHEGGGEEDFVDCLLGEQVFGSELIRDNVKAVIADMLTAGSDTSAAAISWAMAELLRNPRTMKIAQHEVRGLIAGGDSDKRKSQLLVSESDLSHLHYLKAVVKETLRLHMVVPLLVPRETKDACCLGGYSIPAGARVYVNAWAIARDVASWEEPEKFLPERFVGTDVDYSDAGGAIRDDFRFLPFGAGRRSCPGARFGAVVVELALANLIGGFDWELPDGVDGLDMAEAPGIAVGMRSGPVLKVTGTYTHNV